MNSEHINQGRDTENRVSLNLLPVGFASAKDLIGYISIHMFIVNYYLFIGFNYHALEKDSRHPCLIHLKNVATVNCLETFLDDPDGVKENSENFFEDVENAWRNVEAKHKEYVSTLGDEINLEPKDQWITDVQQNTIL